MSLPGEGGRLIATAISLQFGFLGQTAVRLA